MVETIKKMIRGAFRRVRRWIPEALLVVFAVSLLPLVYYLGRIGINMGTMLFQRPGLFWTMIQSSPWTTVAWVATLAAVGGVVWLLVFTWKQLWAVARKMILEALNRKVIVGLLIFFMVLMPSLRFILETEGSLKSQVQIVLTYSLTLAQILLSLIAVFLSTASLCGEIEQKHVFLVDSKPLARWRLLAGKLMGVIVMSAALLFLMGGTVYGLVNHLARPRAFTEMHEWEAEKHKKMLRKVREEVMVSRLSRQPALPDVTAQVEQKLEDPDKTGQPKRGSQQREEIKKRLWKQYFTASSGQALRMLFPGVRPGTQSPLYLRFKPSKTNPKAPNLVRGTWVFYALKREKGKDGKSRGGKLVPAFRRSGKWVPGAYQEIKVPPQVVTPRGTVHAVFWNFQRDTGVQFDPQSGVEVLQKVGGFFPNFYRSLVVILCHIVVLTAVALMLSAALTFPVASFTVGAILVVGLLGRWVTGTALSMPSIPPGAGIGVMIGIYVKATIYFCLRAIFFVLPQFGRFSPMGDLANGRLVSWGFVGQAISVMCVVKGGLAMLLGSYFYWRRELARIIA